MNEVNGEATVVAKRFHTLVVLVENKPGVLTRVAGLFARRGFNIDSLAVARTDAREKVYPMVPAGLSKDEIVVDPSQGEGGR